MGEVGILNVGAGDNKLVFDPADPQGMIRAARIVRDMIRRGYALLVGVGKDDQGRPKYQRATDFDETKCEYIIADFDGASAEKTDNEQDAGSAPESGKSAGKTVSRGRGGSRRVSATSTGAVAVGRPAGG